MTDCIFHPENLEPGKWYEFTFTSALADEMKDGKTFTVSARFKALVIGNAEADNEVGMRLKIAIRVGQETCLRRISWSRILKIEPIRDE
jgi:hypothetical protein